MFYGVVCHMWGSNFILNLRFSNLTTVNFLNTFLNYYRLLTFWIYYKSFRNLLCYVALMVWIFTELLVDYGNFGVSLALINFFRFQGIRIFMFRRIIFVLKIFLKWFLILNTDWSLFSIFANCRYFICFNN